VKTTRLQVGRTSDELQFLSALWTINTISCIATERSAEGVPCSFPLEQRARGQLVRAQLKDASLVAGRRRRHEGELLRKLSSLGREKRPQSVMGFLMLSESERCSQGGLEDG
jgi:hypothetical protein